MGREVERQANVLRPAVGGRQRLAQQGRGQAVDQADPFGYRDEMIGRDIAQLGVMPARQGFEGHGALRAQIDHRLEHQAELLFDVRPAQGLLGHPFVQQLLVMAGGEHRQRTTIGALAVIERVVGVLEGFDGVGRHVREGRHAEGAADLHRQVGQQKRRGQGIADPLAKGDQRVVVGIVGQDQRELVAAQARQVHIFFQQAVQALADLGQQAITDAMTELVVDGFETVEVNDAHRQACPRASALAISRSRVVKNCRRLGSPVRLSSFASLRFSSLSCSALAWASTSRVKAR